MAAYRSYRMELLCSLELEALKEQQKDLPDTLLVVLVLTAQKIEVFLKGAW
jgi:hypothetical protein